jgi:beta-phosphoglucomutase-like phosphatase (HAD superfamily)
MGARLDNPAAAASPCPHALAGNHARMPQFGGGTVITHDTRLILLDCFETLVELEGGAYRPRRGMRDFLAHFASRVGTPLAVVSDAGRSEVERAVASAGVGGFLVRIYHGDNAAEDLGGGRRRKRLDLAVADFKVTPAQAVFIGDSPLDAEAARHYGVRFIRVPRSEDRGFSFASLITGPSRYRSQEFNLKFLECYGKDAKPGGPPP